MFDEKEWYQNYYYHQVVTTRRHANVHSSSFVCTAPDTASVVAFAVAAVGPVVHLVVVCEIIIPVVDVHVAIETLVVILIVKDETRME